MKMLKIRKIKMLFQNFKWKVQMFFKYNMGQGGKKKDFCVVENSSSSNKK